MDEDHIEIVTPVSAEKRRALEVKSRLLTAFAVLSVFVYCGVVAAMALNPYSGSGDFRVSKMAARMLPADGINSEFR
jgi:hypothetical protein